MARAYYDSIHEGKSPQYAYALAILSGGVAFVFAQTGDTIAVLLAYALLAAIFASLWPQSAWQWAVWLCLPLFLLIVLDVVMTGSVRRLLPNMTVFAKALPLACLGIYVGSRLSIRRIANRRATMRLERKRSTRSSVNRSSGVKERAAHATIRQPSFSFQRYKEHIKTIEPVPPTQSLTEALIKAAQACDLDKIGLLVAQGVDVNAMSDDKCTPLMIAALGGDTEMVEALFGKGAEAGVAGRDGWTALMIATIEGHAEVVRALVEHGADVNAVNGRGWTALRFAVSMDELEILRLLLDAGADANVADEQGQTALMQAACEDLSAIIKTLLDAGADPHARDKSGRTALMIARERGSTRSIRHLKEAVAKAPAPLNLAGCLECDDDSYLYLLKEDLEEKLSHPATATSHRHDDVTEMVRSALQAVQEQIESTRKERLLVPSELSHKLMLTLPEASTLSGLPRQHLLEAIEGGTLQARLIKHGWRITRASLDEYIRRLSS
ncbi:MAG TPA: ankyrin repeat domain-containing protein [Pyrinomonadaceae bacterium]|nr:ankyrin repeat domain-containing protein [Pyrinomonadaceae bacterium]